MRFVYMGALAAALTWMVQIMTYVVDAYALTVSSEIMRIIQKAIGFFMIGALFVMHQLSLFNYFIYNYIISIILIVAFIILLSSRGIAFYKEWRLKATKINEYIHEFYHYSRPLFIVSCFSIVATLFERWLLQKFGGSIQQGFYGLSYQIGSICILFTTAMSSIMMREFAIAYKDNAVNEMSRMFRRYVPLLYSIAAFIACFISIQSDAVTFIFGGKQFSNATIPVMIMALYPIHQTYGQLNSTIFLATGQTKIYSIISLVFILVGLPMVYFLIAPAEQMGFEKGATGLAIKMVFIQFIAVNVQLFYHSKYLKLPFIKYFAHQIISVCLFILLAFVSKKIVSFIPVFENNILGNVVSSGFMYCIMVLPVLLFFPKIFGLYPDDIKNGIEVIERQFINLKSNSKNNT